MSIRFADFGLGFVEMGKGMLHQKDELHEAPGLVVGFFLGQFYAESRLIQALEPGDFFGIGDGKLRGRQERVARQGRGSGGKGWIHAAILADPNKARKWRCAVGTHVPNGAKSG